jgi:hypothetical protein
MELLTDGKAMFWRPADCGNGAYLSDVAVTFTSEIKATDHSAKD